MKKGFFVFAAVLLAGFAANAQPQISETDMKASEIAKAMLQNKASFESLNQTEQAAVCSGVIASYQICLQGNEAGEQVFETNKYLFGQIYGDVDAYESYLKGGAVYGVLLAKATQNCDAIGDFINNKCQEMMQKNAQYIQQNFGALKGMK